MSKQFPRLDEFVRFVNERWAIHERRLAGEPAPWTKDPILQKYRFTNVMREHDRVTIWIHKNWLQPHSTDYDTVVFAMALARLVNLPSMLEVLGYPLRWDAKRFVKLMDARRATGKTAYNNAYMINAVGATKGQSKAGYLADQVLGPLWKERKYLGQHVSLPGSTLSGLQDCLMTFHGFGGGFMSAQVVADVKWLPVMKRAEDWFTFARSGPGSRRGLNWLCGNEPTARWNEGEWHSTLIDLMKAAQPKLKTPVLDAQNFQSLNCEWGKYCKVKFAGGRAKQQFKPDLQPYV
jgi:hypothetical protein